MKLIIAEKPELGRAIADALPGSGRTEQAVFSPFISLKDGTPMIGERCLDLTMPGGPING